MKRNITNNAITAKYNQLIRNFSQKQSAQSNFEAPECEKSWKIAGKAKRAILAQPAPGRFCDYKIAMRETVKF